MEVGWKAGAVVRERVSGIGDKEVESYQPILKKNFGSDWFSWKNWFGLLRAYFSYTHDVVFFDGLVICFILKTISKHLNVPIC